MNRKYFFLMILGFLILYPASSWLMMLLDMLRWGKRLIFEPNMLILYTELSITAIAFIATLFLTFWFYLRALRGEKH